MGSNVFSISRPANFSRRVQLSLKNAGVSPDEMKNFCRFPRVQRMFYLATPLALRMLDRNNALLRDLNAFFGRATLLSNSLLDRIEDLGLKLGYCHDGTGKRLVFYTLRASSKEDDELLAKMRGEMLSKPGIEDAEILFDAFGLKLRTMGIWDYPDLIRLTEVEMSDILSVAKGGTNLVIARLGPKFAMARANDHVALTIQRSNETLKLVEITPAPLK